MDDKVWWSKSKKLPGCFLRYKPVSCWLQSSAFTVITLTTLKNYCINHGDLRFFFQFEVIINVLVSSFLFICILMLWATAIVLFYYFSAGIDYRFWRLKSVLALKVVFRYRDPQLQRGVNYSYLINLSPTFFWHCRGGALLLWIVNLRQFKMILVRSEHFMSPCTWCMNIIISLFLSY